MNKEGLRDLLKNYKANKSKRNRLRLDLERFDKRYKRYIDDYEIKLGSSYDINSDIRPKNKISDKVATAVIKRDEKIEDLKKNRESLVKDMEHYDYLVLTTEEYLKVLNENDRAIMVARYIDGYTRDYIANDIYLKLYGTFCSIENIDKITNRAFNIMLK